MPKVIFQKLEVQDNLDSLVWYADPQNSRNSPLDFYKFTLNLFPGLKGKLKNNLSESEIYEILVKEVSPILQRKYNESNDDKSYSEIWNKINDNIMYDLEKKLNIKWPNEDIICRIGLLPVCPRDIVGKNYIVSYGCSEDELIATSIHELCHFIYFEKWKEIYPDFTEQEFDNPHIAWYLSEAMIDPIINNETFKKYTTSELVSYSSFYETFIDGRNIIDILRQYVNNYPIEEAIKKGYEFFKKYENKIKGY